MVIFSGFDLAHKPVISCGHNSNTDEKNEFLLASDLFTTAATQFGI